MSTPSWAFSKSSSKIVPSAKRFPIDVNMCPSCVVKAAPIDGYRHQTPGGLTIGSTTGSTTPGGFTTKTMAKTSKELIIIKKPPNPSKNNPKSFHQANLE